MTDHNHSTGKVLCLIAALVLVVVSLGAAAPTGSAAPPAGEGPGIVFGPCVTHASTTGAQILWVVRPGAAPRCEFQLDDAQKAAPPKVETTTAAVPKRSELICCASVTGLAPGQTYRYTVTSGADRVEGSFQAPPAAGSPEPLKFVVYGDTRTNIEDHRAVIKAMQKELPLAFVLHTGDFVTSGMSWSLWKTEFFDPAHEVLRRTILWPIRGNHEEDAVYYRALFDLPNDGDYYSYDVGDLHVAVLNSELQEDKAEHDKMLAWFDRDLAATKARWKMVSYHEPTFNLGGHASRYGQDSVLPLLEKYGVDIVFTGHSHLYERFRPIGPKGRKPVIYVVTGGGGAPLYKTRPSPLLAASLETLHLCTVTIQGDRLELTAKKVDGEVIDHVVLVKKGDTFQDEIMKQAVTTDEAIAVLTQAMNHLVADFDAVPKPGQPIVGTLPPEALPAYPLGCKVEIRQAADSAWKVKNGAWKVKETSFVVDGKPHPIELTPPAGADIFVHSLCRFDPPPKVSLTLTYPNGAHTNAETPIFLSDETMRRLVIVPPPVLVPHAPANFTIDGQLDDWKNVPYLYLPSTKRPGTHLRLAWSDKGLYGALATADKDIKVDRRRIIGGDGLELDFETNEARSAATYRNRFASRLCLAPQEQGTGGRPLAMTQCGLYNGSDVTAAWRKTADGYTLEFFVPAECLRPARFQAGTHLGFHFTLRDGKTTVEEFINTAKTESVNAVPLFWGTVELADGAAGAKP